MEIIKTLNTSDESYYEVRIIADSNDGDDIEASQTYTEQTFCTKVIPALLYLLKNCMGQYGLEENYNDSLSILPIPQSENGICHTIDDVDGLLIRYFDKNGMCFNVTLKY